MSTSPAALQSGSVQIYNLCWDCMCGISGDETFGPSSRIQLAWLWYHSFFILLKVIVLYFALYVDTVWLLTLSLICSSEHLRVRWFIGLSLVLHLSITGCLTTSLSFQQLHLLLQSAESTAVFKSSTLRQLHSTTAVSQVYCSLQVLYTEANSFYYCSQPSLLQFSSPLH